MRHSLTFCSWKDRKYVAADLRRIYEAATADQAVDWLEDQSSSSFHTLTEKLA